MSLSQLIFQILIEFLVVFSLAAGVSGVILFSVMLVSLRALRSLGQFFNEVYSLKKIEAAVNRRTGKTSSSALISHPRVFGSFLCLISVCLSFFFICRINPDALTALLPVAQKNAALFEMLFQSLQLLFLVCFAFVFVFGLLLLFKQKLATVLCSAFDRWYNIDDSIESRLDETISKDIDTISFLMNKSIGLTGLVFSIILVLLSLYDLLLVM